MTNVEQAIERDPDLLSVQEAADYLRVHHQTVRRILRRGDLPAYRLGPGQSEIRIRRGDLERWLEKEPDE